MTNAPRVAEGTASLDRALATDPRRSAKARAEFMHALRSWAMSVARSPIRQPERLPPLARTAYVLFALWGEVLTEGLEFWIGESREGRCIDLAEDGCRLISASGSADVLARVRALFDGGSLADDDFVRGRLEELEELDVNPLTALSDSCRPVLDAEIPAALHTYFMAQRAAAFAELV